MLHRPFAAIVSFADEFALMVPCWDDLVPFRDDPARIVARVDDCSRRSVTHMDPPPDDADKRSAARIAALQKALKSIRLRTDECDSTSRRGAPLEQRGFAEHDLIDEITSAGQRIGEARDWNAEPVYRTDGVWRVLVTVAKSRYCLAIADVARAVGVRRQAAHRLVHEPYERESLSSSLTRRTGGCYKW